MLDKYFFWFFIQLSACFRLFLRHFFFLPWLLLLPSTYFLYKCFGSSQVITYAITLWLSLEFCVQSFYMQTFFQHFLAVFDFFLVFSLFNAAALDIKTHFLFFLPSSFSSLPVFPSIVKSYFIRLVIMFASCWGSFFTVLIEYHLHFNDYLWAPNKLLMYYCTYIENLYRICGPDSFLLTRLYITRFISARFFSLPSIRYVIGKTFYGFFSNFSFSLWIHSIFILKIASKAFYTDWMYIAHQYAKWILQTSFDRHWINYLNDFQGASKISSKYSDYAKELEFHSENFNWRKLTSSS